MLTLFDVVICCTPPPPPPKKKKKKNRNIFSGGGVGDARRLDKYGRVIWLFLIVENLVS